MIRKFLPLALAALLSACWQSDYPLIPDTEVDSPKIAGKYTNQTTDSDGKTSTEPVSLTREPSGDFMYEAGSPGGSLTRRKLRLDKVQGDWYLVQSQSETAGGDWEKPYYRILKVSKNVLEEYDPACEVSDTLAGHVSVSGNDCTFLTYEGLKATAQKRVTSKLGGDQDALTLTTTYRK